MFKLFLECVDTITVAESQDGSFWTVLLIDRHSGKTHSLTCTLAELTAMFALGVGSVGENNTPGYWSEKLYDTARPALKDCPPECYPIP